MALTEKKRIFVDEFLIDLNATRAYKTAYPKVKNDDAAEKQESHAGGERGRAPGTYQPSGGVHRQHRKE